jgi:mannose-6-phosphate isomerase-like protein (cupin superfamily)
MLVKSLVTAKPYDAPNHRLIDSVRLLGFEPDGPTSFWVGHSTVHPGGDVGPDASPIEKVYVVLNGSLTITSGSETRVLGPMHACRIPPNETRKFINLTDSAVTLLVIMPYPPAP